VISAAHQPRLPITLHGLDAYVLERADAAVDRRRRSRALRRDPELSARLAAGAADFARQQFSWARSAESLATLYDSLF
jgi:glycosyltransferase involved in cell wall biosynthesis